MTQIDDTITTYLTALAVEGKRPRTIESYDETLRAFRRAGHELALPDAIEDYTVEHAYAFRGDLQARGASAAYRNRRHREVRAFFSWCQKMGQLDLDRRHVFARVKLAPEEKRVKPPFSVDEVRLLLDGQDRSRLNGCRVYALLLFLLDTGVRVTECFDVRLEEVDWEQGHVLVHGKGNKQRHVGIGERTADALRDYIDRFRGDGPGALFQTRDGRPFASPNAIRVILRRIAKTVGLATKANPHRFRYTFATWAIASGAREIDVQLLLGHSSPQMTQHYARAYDAEQAVHAHAALSPVAQLPPAADGS